MSEMVIGNLVINKKQNLNKWRKIWKNIQQLIMEQV